MATRRSEWLASIKPILDRDEAKRDAAALAKELGDILEVKVDASPENLNELAKEFNAQLKNMGKQPIVFSEKTLSGIVSQFANAISAGITAGVAKVDFSAQLDELNKKREKVVKAQNRANQAMKARTRMERLEAFDINTAKLMPIDGDVAKEAQQLIDILYDSADKIDEAAKKYGKSSSHYTSAVMDAQEAYNKYLRMQKTLGTMPSSQLSAIPKDIRALYDKLGPDREKYEVGGGTNIPFEETFEAEKILDSFEELSDAFENIIDNATKYDKMLVQIDAKIEEITRKARESGDIDEGILSGAKDGLKTLNEIEAAYKRLKVDKGMKLRQQNESHIKSALDFDPEKNNIGIKTFAKDYYDAAASGDWVEEYHALLRYVKLYESYLTSTNKTHQNKVTAKNNPFTPLYEQLKPMAENARNMLQNILNMGEGKPLVGMGGAGNGDSGVGLTPEDVANSQKIREDAEAKVRAEREALELARQRREEEEKLAKAAEKKRLADEAAAEANRKSVGETKKENQSYTGYRAVHPPEGSGKTKSDALEDWGAEYFTTRKDTAASYGQDFYEKGDIVIGEITPKNPLIINANGVRWDEFEKMPDVLKVFPELLDKIKENPKWTGDDKQKYINERARVMGYDSVVTENVQDALDGDKKQYELSTTIAVLDDSIVRLTGSMEQLEAGTSKFSDTVSPKIPSYYITGSQESAGASAEVQDVGAAFKRLIDYINSSGQEPKQFFSTLAGGAQAVNDELKQILSALGLFDSQGNLNLKSIESGFTNLGGMVSDTYTLIARGKEYLPKSQDLMPKLIDAKQMGANIGEILDIFEDKTTGKIYELQRTMPGTIIPDNADFLKATDEQILNLIADLQTLHKTGLSIDFGNDNILYDKDQGFSFIDLGTRLQEGQETVAGTAQELLKSIKPVFADNKLFGDFENRLINIANILGVKIPQAAQGAEQAVDSLNAKFNEAENIESNSEVSGGIGGASSAELEAEKAKAESLQNELEQKNSDITEKDNELQRVKSEKDAALQAVNNEKQTLQNDLDVVNRQNAELREQASNDGDAIFTAEQRANEAEEKAAMYDRAMTSMQEEMADLRGKLADTKTGEGKYASVNSEELKNVLNSIVYNVKIAHDDADKTANKIALDDSTLESTLTKVFANILNPQTQQNDSEQVEKHWALESTLQTVKGVLDNIHTNTTKIGTVKSINVDTIASTAFDGRLTEIKSILESIDQKVAKGGVMATRGAVKQANSQSVESETKTQAARSNMMKSIINDYKTLGKLSAQFASNGNLETKAMLENLKEEIARKRQSLKLTMDENASLREKYGIAFDAEKRLLDAEKAQKEINAQVKADAKEAETAWKKQVKDAQRSTGINAATSAANAGDQTVVRAIGTEGISKDIEDKAKDLAGQIKALRVLRDEIDKKGEQATNEDRDNLGKQISKVKELKTEVDGYLKIHEKYSGEGVTDLGDASNFGAVGTNEYWNNITAAIKNASSGKTTIKGLNADTGELTGTTKIAANTFAQWSATVDPLTGRLSMLRTGIKKTETLVETITRKTKEIFTYFSGSSIIFKVFNELKKGVQYVRDIDLALTELKKVTDETEETYDRFLETAAKTADKVGSTIQKVVSSTADWARLGYSMKEAAEFAESTQILMNVSEFTDVSQATDTLISAVQAFGYTAETSMDVVDLLNTIGNNYAISTADLAKSLTKSSASLVAAGGDLAEAAALTATANAIIQDADSVGTALKTTSLRLRGTSVKVLEEEGLDTDGAVESTSKLRSQVLATSGVDILTDSGAYKSTYQILLEIAEVWDKITDDKARAGLLELLAGKRNSSVIAALLQNPEQLKAAYKDAQNASGSALKENERYLDSIQGKIDQFNNAVQSMWSNALDSDVVKFLVDLATQLVKIVDAVGPLNVALVGLFAYLGKQHGIFDSLFKPAGDGLEELKRQLAKAERDLAKAEEADLRNGTNKTAEKRRNAEERVEILRQRVLEASEDAVLEGIDESFDPEKVKKQIAGKKGARTKRINKLQAEGKTFDEIQADSRVQQYTREIEEAEQALNEYNATVQRTNVTTQQASATTQVNTAANQANAASNTASAAAETADATATNASAAADVNAANATGAHTAATWADVWAEMTRTGATGASVAATIKQVLATKLANSALVQKGLAIMGVTAAEGASIPVTTMLAGGFVGLASSIWSAITAMWTFMVTTPIGWILAAVAAVVALGVAIASIHKSTEELQEELDGFKSELSDIRSELDAVNQELESTNERIAELLAKDKLTFEEQEELDRLRETNDELERRKELLETEKEYKSGLVGRQAAKVVDSKRNEIGWWLNGKSEDEEVLDNIEDYRDLKNKLNNVSSLEDRKEYQKELDEKGAEIDEYIAVISEALDGVEYGDSEESDTALDYLAELQDTYGIARGSTGAKTNAIKGIAKKDEFSSMSKAINYYVEALKNGDENAADAMAEIINENEDFVADLKARGLEAQDAIDLYVRLGEDMQFDTLEGKTNELKKATDQLPNALNDISQFMDGDEVDTSAVAEYFKGTSTETREEIAKLIQQINDGEISVKNALKQFELFGIKSVLDIEITEVQTNFKDVFTDLEDADGLIDSFQELADAIGSTSKAMDSLNAAQAEMEYSGRVSIETALKLMESTDDYSKVLTISEGKLVLAENAEENLIDARIEGMKASALKALEEAKAARETTVLARSNAETALSTYNSAIESEMAAAVTATAWDKVLAAAAGLWAGIKSLFTDESWTEAYDRAYQETLNSLSGDRVAEVKNKYASVEEQAKKAQLQKDIDDADKAIKEQDEEIEKLQGNYDLVSGLNKDNIGDVFKSDDLKDPEDAAKTKLDEAMERFQQEMDYWENRIGANQARYEQLQNEIDLLEAKGQRADTSFYEEQIKLEKEREALLLEQKAAAEDYLEMLEFADLEGSEEWWEVANTLNDIEGELDDVTASIVDLQDAIGEIDAYKFEEFNTRLDNLTSKLETIRNLIAPNGEEDWFDDEGNWTETGVAYLGSYLQDLEFFKQGYQNTMDELAKYESPYVGNESYYETLGIHSEQEYYDKVEELTSQQYDYMSSISDTEQSIVDMYESSIDAVEEYVNTLIDGYNDYIDSVKEALDAERKLYDFKKSVQKQAKDIAEIERRIASLSGSTNASDIAERRKLEAQLYESRESLNDTYYDHAKDSQNEALDSEAAAYEESMTKFVEGLRISLEEATANMDEFLMGVTSMVMYNADTVLAKYEETNLPLTTELTNPWIKAKEAVGTYSGNALDLMNQWTKEGGFFAQFNTSGTTNLTSPWSAGTTAATNFKNDVGKVMEGVVSNISTNVQNAKTDLADLYKQIQDTETKAANANVTVNNSGNNNNPASSTQSQKQYYATASLPIYSQTLKATGSGTTMADAKSAATIALLGKYENLQKSMGRTQTSYENLWQKTYRSKVLYSYQYHAKGTTGTTRDEWAITDEPQFGDELVLVPGKDGNLSFMRKGTGVVPADLTANLMEWGQFTPDSFNLGGGVNINMINNAVNKPEFNLNVDNFLRCDNVSQDAMPELKQFVKEQMDSLVKQMNYSIKRFSR